MTAGSHLVVTGSTGSLGRRLLALATSDPGVEHVTGVDLVAPPTAPGGAELAMVDLTVDELEPIFDGADTIVHLAFASGQAADDEANGSRNVVATRRVLDAAAEGDATARQIAATHGGMLGDYALAAARQVGIERAPFTLVLAGGVLRHPSQLIDSALIARVQSAAPGVQVVARRFEPAVGALFMALEAEGVAIDEPLL